MVLTNLIVSARMHLVAGAMVGWLLSGSVCWAQNFKNRPVGGTSITVQGVYIDAQGVLRHRKILKGRQPAFRKDLTQDPSLCYISLPRLFAEVQKLTSAGEEIPERMRFLDGMVRLKHVFVLPEERDLVIAGPAEQWDAANPLRPRGTLTGRPVLQLDDLVVALRHIGPGSRSRVFGCTLVQDAGAVGRVAALQSKLGPVPARRQNLVAAALKKAIGPLEAKFFGVPSDTRFAFIAVEADYLMKRLSLGLDRSPVRGLKSYLAMSSGGSMFNRFWFTANYEPLLVSEDGNEFEIRGQGLRLLASDNPAKAGTANAAARKFADDFTRQLPRLEEAVPCFADLHSLADLAVLAALIAEDRLHERIAWDLGWVLDPRGYRVAKRQVPKQAETLVNYQRRGRRTITVAGGVQVSVGPVVGKRQTRGRDDASGIIRVNLDEQNWSLRVKDVGQPPKTRRLKP